MASVPAHHFYRPGDVASVSGTYRVVHRNHRPEHRVLLVKGDEFPQCRRCAGAVSFELVENTDYATDDWDLAGPNLRLVESHLKSPIREK